MSSAFSCFFSFESCLFKACCKRCRFAGVWSRSIHHIYQIDWRHVCKRDQDERVKKKWGSLTLQTRFHPTWHCKADSTSLNREKYFRLMQSITKCDRRFIFQTKLCYEIRIIMKAWITVRPFIGMDMKIQTNRKSIKWTNSKSSQHVCEASCAQTNITEIFLTHITGMNQSAEGFHIFLTTKKIWNDAMDCLCLRYYWEIISTRNQWLKNNQTNRNFIPICRINTTTYLKHTKESFPMISISQAWIRPPHGFTPSWKRKRSETTQQFDTCPQNQR